MPERLVLTLDGSTRTCGVALVALTVGGKGARAATTPPEWSSVGERLEGECHGGSRSLLRLIDGLLREAGASPGDLRAVVVGTGPGTFTGVRLAVATARALALSLRCPVAGVSTLGALAARAALEIEVSERDQEIRPERLVSFVDARRGQLFYAVYEAFHPRVGERSEAASGDPTRKALGFPGVAPGPAWRRVGEYGVCEYAELSAVVGAGLSKGVGVGEVECLPVSLPTGWSGMSFAVTPENLVLGQELLVEPDGEPGGYRTSLWLADAVAKGQRSWSGALPGMPGTPEAVKPIYVRSPDADIHITKMRDPWA